MFDLCTMDLYDLPHLSFSGLTLNVEERSGLDLAMRKRQLDEHLETVLFWGKISGQEADYLIVYGYPPSTEFPRKQFYAWCVYIILICVSGDLITMRFPAV